MTNEVSRTEAGSPPDRLADIAERAGAVLVDFDGPICRLFGGNAAPRIAADLRQLILSRGVVLPDELRDGDDPLELFRATAVVAPELAGVLARTRRPVSQLPWVDSGGGPLIVVPTSALGAWEGASVDDDDSWGDYERACRVDGHVGVLDVGADQALVLADEPASTTYLPDRRIFVRWSYAASEADVVRLIPRAVTIARWEDAGTWTTSGPAELFDSGHTGNGLEHTAHLTVDLAAGTYLIRTASVQPDRRTALVLVQLVEQAQPVRVREQVRTRP
ncbi:Imm21 family immunity protein [Micromonospora chokoriensis]